MVRVNKEFTRQEMQGEETNQVTGGAMVNTMRDRNMIGCTVDLYVPA